MIKVGSRWASTDKKFRVISVVELEGNIWVHYREENNSTSTEECKEYSCYEESFVARYRQMVE